MDLSDVDVLDCVINRDVYPYSYIETPYLFFDFDGTIREAVDNTNGRKVKSGYGSKYSHVPPREIEDVEIFKAVIPVLAQWKKRGFKMIGVTNQSGVQCGYMSIEKCKLIINETLRQLGMEFPVIFAPLKTGDNEGVINLRKPNIGAFELASHLYGPILKERSYMIGDRNGDITAGKNAGIKTFKVDMSKKGKDFPLPK